MQMVMFTLGNGKTITQTDKVHTSMLMELDMRVTGVMINKVDKEWRFG